MISRLHSNGVQRLLFFKSLSPYSTVAEPQAHFLASHLENLLGLSKEEAVSSISKVTMWKSSKKDPNVVLNFFRKLGLDESQIKIIVTRDPRLLLYDVDKTLEPKIQVLREIGFSRLDINKLIVVNRSILSKGVDSGIRRPIEFFRESLGSDENVVKAVMACCGLLDYCGQKNTQSNVEALKQIGFSNEKIRKFLIRSPMRITRDPRWFQEVIHTVENEYGIPRESKMFYYGLHAMSLFKKGSVDAKFEIYRNYGFTDEQIYRMFRTFPFVLTKSDAKVQQTIKYIVEELGHTHDFLVSYPVLFGLSVEKRMKPRYEVMKILIDKKLINRKPGLCYLFHVSESRFVSKFLLPHKEKLPDMYQSYMETVGR